MSRKTRERSKQLTWLTEAQAAVGWGIIIILAALLGTIYLRQVSQIASVGRRVQLLQNDLSDLKRSNADLERRIAAAQSLDRLQQEAARLGFVPADPDDIEYITVPNYPVRAEPAATATPPPTPAPPPPETMLEALWLKVRQDANHLIRGEARE